MDINQEFQKIINSTKEYFENLGNIGKIGWALIALGILLVIISLFL